MNEGGCSGLRSTTGRRCEYCQLHEEDDDYLSFHVEHIIAKKHGGTDDPELLCFSCAQCNWAKGPNIAGLLDGKIYPLFNPRKTELEEALSVGKYDLGWADKYWESNHSGFEHKRAIPTHAPRESIV